MEAPEKIYIVNDDLNIKREWYKTKQVGFETTEYTRTDAIVKKIEVICSRNGSPKETFETPKIVFPLYFSFMYFTV